MTREERLDNGRTVFRMDELEQAMRTALTPEAFADAIVRYIETRARLVPRHPYDSELEVDVERHGDTITLTPKGGLIVPTGQDLALPQVAFHATTGEPISHFEVRIVREEQPMTDWPTAPIFDAADAQFSALAAAPLSHLTVFRDPPRSRRRRFLNAIWVLLGQEERMRSDVIFEGDVPASFRLDAEPRSGDTFEFPPGVEIAWNERGTFEWGPAASQRAPIDPDDIDLSVHPGESEEDFKRRAYHQLGLDEPEG